MKQFFFLITLIFLVSCSTISTAVTAIVSNIKPKYEISNTGKHYKFQQLHIKYDSTISYNNKSYIINPISYAQIVGTNNYYDKEFKSILNQRIAGGTAKTYYDISIPVDFSKDKNGNYTTASHHYVTVKYYTKGNVVGTAQIPLEIQIINGTEKAVLNLAKYAPSLQKKYCPHNFNQNCNRCGYIKPIRYK